MAVGVGDTTAGTGVAVAGTVGSTDIAVVVIGMSVDAVVAVGAMVGAVIAAGSVAPAATTGAVATLTGCAAGWPSDKTTPAGVGVGGGLLR